MAQCFPRLGAISCRATPFTYVVARLLLCQLSYAGTNDRVHDQNFSCMSWALFLTSIQASGILAALDRPKWRMYEAVAAVDFHQSSPADGVW
jgi:hypothetical protein